MIRTPVTSSNVASIGWSDDVLEVEFLKSGVYHYAGVPETVLVELMKADSVGSFINRKIRPNYPATKVAA